ncbi:MAG: hypothetical protein ABI480_02455 [Chitinophagaceae bacterium]
MIGIFKQKNPANLLILFVIGVLIKLPLFTGQYPAPVVHPSDGLLYEQILSFLNPIAKSVPLTYPLLAYLLLFAQAAVLTQFINNQRMTNKPTYLPGLAYILITSLLPAWNYFSAPLIVNSILLFVLSALFGIYNKQNVMGNVFNIGLFLGFAGFIFIPSLIFVLWVLLAIAVMRPLRINEWLICILGITTPSYFYAIYLVIKGRWSWDAFLPHISIGLPTLQQSAWLAGSVFLIMVPFLAGGYYVQENLRRMLINVRKAWSLLLLFLLTSLLVPFINPSATFENWVMGMLPLAAFHGCAYLYSKWRYLPHLLFWLTVAFIISYQYFGPGW